MLEPLGEHLAEARLAHLGLRQLDRVSVRRNVARLASLSITSQAARGSPSRGWPTEPGLSRRRGPPRSTSCPPSALPPEEPRRRRSASSSATWLCPTRTSGAVVAAKLSPGRVLGEDVVPDRVAWAAVEELDARARSPAARASQERAGVVLQRRPASSAAAAPASSANGDRSGSSRARPDRGCRRGRGPPVPARSRCTRSAAARSRPRRRGTRSRRTRPRRSSASTASSACRFAWTSERTATRMDVLVSREVELRGGSGSRARSRTSTMSPASRRAAPWRTWSTCSRGRRRPPGCLPPGSRGRCGRR